jgi:hypothetical protein
MIDEASIRARVDDHWHLMRSQRPDADSGIQVGSRMTALETRVLSVKRSSGHGM